MNARSSETLVISTLKVSLLSTAGIILYQEINLTGSRNNAVDEILIHETQKVSAVKEAPGFLESDYDEKIFIRLKI